MTVSERDSQLSAIVPLPISVMADPSAFFAPLAGEPPLVRAVRSLGAGDTTTVIVSVAAPLAGNVREVLAAHGLSAVRVAVASEPGARAHCLEAALDVLAGDASEARCVLVHHIRQPLISAGLRSRVIAAVLGGGVVVMPALPLTDSVKTVDTEGSITGTLDRATLRTAQYPRGFAVDQLAQLLIRRVSDDFDELAEALRGDMPVTMVEGDPNAFVAELPRDTEFVEAIISESEDPRGS